MRVCQRLGVMALSYEDKRVGFGNRQINYCMASNSTALWFPAAGCLLFSLLCRTRGGEGGWEVGDSRRGREMSNHVYACISTTLDLKCFITASCADDPWVVLIGRFPCGCLISLHYVCVLGLCPPGFMEAESKGLRHCITLPSLLKPHDSFVWDTDWNVRNYLP